MAVNQTENAILSTKLATELRFKKPGPVVVAATRREKRQRREGDHYGRQVLALDESPRRHSRRSTPAHVVVDVEAHCPQVREWSHGGHVRAHTTGAQSAVAK